MDRVIDQIADYCVSLTFDDLPAPTVHAATQRLIDTLACAVGGYGCESAEIGRRLAPVVDVERTRYPSRWLGAPAGTTTSEAAGFVNSAMIRYLDFNDTYPGGHPSDALGPVLALADSLEASGRDLVTALVAGYDIFIRQANAAKLRERGWDQGFGIGLATTAGASVLLGLDRECTRHALSLSAVSNVPLRATRAGQLTLWKGTATSYAARNALFGTFLAAEGMTAPEAPIEGRHGLQDLVTGPFELPPFNTDADSFLTHWARIKYWPVEYNLQAVVWAAIELRERVDASELASVDIATNWSSWHETASESAKWDPRSRETADHSMPYVFIRSLQAGELTLSAFDPEAYLAEDVRPLMQKVSVHVDEDINAQYPDVVILRATATTTDGQEHLVEVVNPRGHENNPVTDDELAGKFARLVDPVLGPSRGREALDFWWKIADHGVREGLDLFAFEDEGESR